MRDSNSLFRYQEANLPPDLEPYINKMWYSHVGVEQLEEPYLPRPFPFFVVLLKGKVRIERVGIDETNSPLISINGTMKESRAVLHFKDPIESIGIDLTSHGFLSLFGESPYGFRGKTFAINNFLSMDEQEVIEAINEVKKVENKLSLLLDYLRPHFKSIDFNQNISHAYLASIVPSCNYQVGELADKMCVSEKTLNRLCKEFVGTSPKNYINIVRVNQAYAIAKVNPQKPVHEIAHQFGFYDVQHMAKTFKHYLGLNLFGFRNNRSSEASSIWAN
ncbi:helix-turn-helix domain-containing protein [Reichenbachiella sp.]|uniref:helix-turn-helix domain-containing protein n=1 Tax=Reichenbachiella sp. TaxID=2184521 RepID=UPI003B5CDBD6